MAEGWRMWAISLLTIMLLTSISAAPLDITDDIKKEDVKADNDAMHSHDENVIREGKFFGHNQFDIGNINVPGSVAGDDVSIGHEVNIDVQGHNHDHHLHEGDTVIEYKEGLREMFKSIDSNKDGLIDAMELLRVCLRNNIQITKPLALRILTLPEKTVGLNIAKFYELLKDCPSTNNADSIYCLLQLFDKGNVEECIWENSHRIHELTKLHCADVPKSKDGKREFRTIDGCCNNIDNHLFGMSGTPLRRMIDAEYTTNPQTKTMDNPREASRGGELPSARLVSNTIFKAGVKTDGHFTHLLMMIGQFLDHDLVHVPTIPGDCCHGAEGFDFPTSIEDPNRCFPIRVPEDDPIWGVGGSKGTRRTCMELKRSIFGPTLDCKSGVREHTSDITHWIDMSMIYGNNETWLRNPKERHLLLITNPTENNQRPLLPRCWTMLPEEQKLLDNHKRGEFEICETCKEEGNKDCFFSGDVRTNENPALATMHTIWLREHNRIAMELLSLNPRLTKDDIFEEARRIVIAEWQQIVYKEWLPIVIGNNFMNKFEMHPRKSGYSTRYNPSIDPRISNEFASAAFRFGHTLVFDKIPQRDFSNQEQPPVDLKTVFGDSSGLNEPNFVDKTVRGMVGDFMPAMDADFAEDILHNLFKELLDLPAINIQRARDHGIPGYNKYRGVCESVATGFGAVSSIDELTKDGRISQDDVNSLKQIYDHVDDIDLFVGGTLEFFGPHDDALVGPTFLCIIGDQFRRLKDGDRFFFENGGDSSTRFTLPQLNEIRNKVSMARILCDNTGIGSIQRQPFLQENPYTNPRYDCSDDEGHIPRLDLTVFVN